MCVVCVCVLSNVCVGACVFRCVCAKGRVCAGACVLMRVCVGALLNLTRMCVEASVN